MKATILFYLTVFISVANAQISNSSIPYCPHYSNFDSPVLFRMVTQENSFSHLPHSNTLNPNIFKFLENFTFNDGITEVNATFIMTTGNNSRIIWRRTKSGITHSGTIMLNNGIPNGDLVVGDGGDKIILATQEGISVKSTSYSWDSSLNNFLLSNSTNVATGNSVGSNKIAFGDPHLAIDNNDKVVIFFRSWNTNLFNSHKNIFFSRAGDLNGNWVNYPGTNYNAMNIGQNLGLPNSFQGGFGDVDMTKYTSNNQVFYLLLLDYGSTSYAYHISISWTNLVNNNSSNLNSKLLDNISNTSFISFPRGTIDGSPSPFFSTGNIDKEWVAAVQEVRGNGNNIRIYRGGGPFANKDFHRNSTGIKGILSLAGNVQDPNIQFRGDMSDILLSFTSNDPDCKNEWDPIFTKLSIECGFPIERTYCRANSINQMAGAQSAVALDAPNQGMGFFLTYFNTENNTIYEPDMETCSGCNLEAPPGLTMGASTGTNGQKGKTGNGGNDVDGEISEIYLYTADGRSLGRFNSYKELSLKDNITYILKIFYTNGQIEIKKVLRFQ